MTDLVRHGAAKQRPLVDAQRCCQRTNAIREHRCKGALPAVRIHVRVPELSTARHGIRGANDAYDEL
jgi:hypothetical protein